MRVTSGETTFYKRKYMYITCCVGRSRIFHAKIISLKRKTKDEGKNNNEEELEVVPPVVAAIHIQVRYKIIHTLHTLQCIACTHITRTLYNNIVRFIIVAVRIYL